MKNLLFRRLVISVVTILIMSNCLTLRANSVSSEIETIAKNITVMVTNIPDNPKAMVSNGSGVIIACDSNNYYLLTANHVVQIKGTYKITTHDGKEHIADNENVSRMKGNLDLAVLSFPRKQNYEVVKFGDSDKVAENDQVYISGFPAPENKYTLETGVVTKFKLPANEIREMGYTLTYHSNASYGMSGGPVLNAEGLLVGIHGFVPPFGSKGGIPINTFKNNADAGIQSLLNAPVLNIWWLVIAIVPLVVLIAFFILRVKNR